MIATNPFVAARISLGALGWVETETGEMDEWASAVSRRAARFQILGEHGAGKSTMLVHLGRAIARRGGAVVLFRCGRGVGSAIGATLRARRVPDVVLADEAQCWDGFRLALLRAACASVGASLVVSAHVDLGFPTLSHRRVTPGLARAVIAPLVDFDAARVPSPESLARRIAAHAGNLREVLFEFYDEVEATRRAGAALI